MANSSLSSVYSFVAGFVQSKDIVRVVAQSDELNDRKTPNTTLLKFPLKDGTKYAFNMLWYATKIVARESPSLEVFAAGPDGRVNVGTATTDVLETIGTGKEGPQTLGHIRDLRLIGGSVIAAGMGRQVYRRAEAGRWTPIHKNILQAPSLKEVRGFNAIHGLDESALVAVGWYGEIFVYANGAWGAQASPTNVILNDVHVTPEGVGFACGAKGTLLRNRGDGWHIVPQDATGEELRSLQWYNGVLYVAADEQLFRLSADDGLEEVNVSKEASTFDSLHANDGLLLSVGPKDIWLTADGKKWNRLD